MTLNYGEPAPWFRAEAAHNPNFAFDTVAGRFVLLGFVPDPARRDEALAHIRSQHARFDEVNLGVFLVIRDPASIAEARGHTPGLRWIHDHAGEVTRQFGLGDDNGLEPGGWFLLDPMLRVIDKAGLEEARGCSVPWPPSPGSTTTPARRCTPRC